MNMASASKDTIQIQVLGAGLDVGRSCLLLTIADRHLLLDCGAHPGFADKRRFPDFASLPSHLLPKLDAILISHFHFDHVAALPMLTETLACTAPVYMTAPTKELSRLMLNDFIATSTARNQYCPFSDADVERCLSKVNLLKLGSTASIGHHKDIHITPYYAGHVMGAVMLLVKHGSKSVLYSGDYCNKSDRYLRSATLPYLISPNLFITEATYCNTIRQERRAHMEEEMVTAVLQTITKGGKVLIPISAFGRVQPICSLLSSHDDNAILYNIPTFIVSGLASKANQLYERFPDWTVEEAQACSQCLLAKASRKRTRFADKCNHTLLSRLRPFHRNDHWHLIHSRRSMILFATPGNMSTGVSRDVFQAWAPHPNNLIVIPGISFSNTISSSLSSAHPSESGAAVDIRCRMVNMTINSHVDAKGIVQMCRQVGAHSVMLVHGEKTKIVAFRDQIKKILNVPCYAPENGQTVIIPENLSAPKQESLTDVLRSQLSENWKKVYDDYMKLFIEGQREDIITQLEDG